MNESGGNQVVREHLREWAEKLIDLTRFNRLLFFQHTRSASFEFAQSGTEILAGLGRSSWRFYLPESGDDGSEDPESETQAELPKADELVVRMSRARTSRSIRNGLKTLQRNTGSEYLDTGLWSLYLGVGQLHWKDVDGRGAVSPILLVPAMLLQDPKTKEWRLRQSEEGETAINPALAVKLERDFNIELSSVEDLDDLEVAGVLRMVRDAVSGTEWTVDETTVLARFTFQKEVIYRDLKANEDEIASHDMVRLLAEGPMGDVPGDLDFDVVAEDLLDRDYPPEDLAMVRDADVSQRQCLLAARSGHSFVMDGPPGTGKSQTITNLIAQFIADGKRVLFVSEKAAALEVVQNRLAALSLDPFVMALHSKTASKKAVATELGESLKQAHSATSRFDSMKRERLIRAREQLSDYAVAINAQRQPLDRSLHDVIGRISQLNDLPEIQVPDVDLRLLSPSEFVEIQERADQLGRAWGPVDRGDEFVWRDLDLGGSEGILESDLRRRVEECQTAIKRLEMASGIVVDDLHLATGGAPSDASRLVGILECAARRMPVAPKWLASSSVIGIADDAHQLAREYRDHQELATQLRAVAEQWERIDAQRPGALSDLVRELESEDPSVLIGSDVNLDALNALALELRAVMATVESLSASAQVLMDGFGEPGSPTVSQLERLAALGNLVGSSAPPEPAWFNPVVQQSLVEAQAELTALLTDFRLRRDRLSSVFTEAVLDLDLTALSARFSNTHTGLKKLSGDYRADKKTLAAVAVSGKCTKVELAHLGEACEWQRAAHELSLSEQRHGALIGERYYPSRDTADLSLLERAVATARQAVVWAAGQVEPDRLARQLGIDSAPDPRIPTAIHEVHAALSALRLQLVPVIAVARSVESPNMTLDALVTWAKRVDGSLQAIIGQLTVLESLGAGRVTIRQGSRLLEQRSRYEAQSQSIKSAAGDVAEFLGAMATVEDPTALDAVASWVKELLGNFEEPIRERTAEAILTTGHDAALIQGPLEVFDKSVEELVSRFVEPQRSAIRAELYGSFSGSRELLELLQSTVGDAAEWRSFHDASQRLRALGWGLVVEECQLRGVASGQVGDVFERAVLQRWADQQMASDGRLDPRRSIDREKIRDEFRQLDAELVKNAAAHIINACSARKPTSSAGQAGILKQQAELKTRHKPVRQLFSMATDAVQRLKPCFMMSPLSVSHFLPPEMRFDVVIFDEASQVREADAVCCIYRGTQLIVAGDQKQLPPTNFFERASDDGGSGVPGGSDSEDEEDIEVLDFESVLDRCKAQGLKSLPLNWHYRSQHESLISFSNYTFYEGRLHTFPGATFDAPDLGVELFSVNGVYGRGTTQDNPIEAEAVVDRVLFHSRHHPESTIGVVALSAKQQRCIEDAIDRRSEQERELQDLVMDSRLDGFFVKNLETVQGDERDIIIFSVGYGPDQYGKLHNNFGPMNKQGGGRRLNVAVTRARRKVEVVSSITAGDIVTSNPSTLLLKKYLDYADRGVDSLPVDLTGSMGEAESPFEEEVISSIREMGYDPVPQVGEAGYRVDIGVRYPSKPGSFVLGVECDGATYHSAKVARDRDRLRQSVLENLGWTIHRIWSTAWFSDRKLEEQRLHLAIQTAISGPARSQPVAQTPVAIEIAVEEVDFDGLPNWTWAYEEPRVPRVPYSSKDFGELHAQEAIRRQVRHLVEGYGPIHEDEVIGALRKAWNIGRFSERMRDSLRAIVRGMAPGVHRSSTGFLSAQGREVRVRVPKSEAVAPRKVEHVSPAELQLAILNLLSDAGPSEPDQFRARWARMFGWRRVGPDIESAFELAVDELVANHQIVLDPQLRLL